MGYRRALCLPIFSAFVPQFDFVFIQSWSTGMLSENRNLYQNILDENQTYKPKEPVELDYCALWWYNGTATKSNKLNDFLEGASSIALHFSS